MKKLYLLLIPAFLIFLTGCGGSGKKMICTISTTSNGIELKADYTIKHDGKYAQSAEFHEEYTPQDSSLLGQLETLIKQTYESANNNFGGYKINVKTSGSKVVADVTVDYEKMDLQKAIQSSEDVKSFVEDGKMSVDKMKSTYESIGYTCK